jgi:hypothetical protein
MACAAGQYSTASKVAACSDCPEGKFQSGSGQPFCESVEEGLFVSDEPAEVLAQQVELPNQEGAVSEDVNRALIEELAEQLGIDPMYISLGGGADGASRKRDLRTGFAFKITILSDDSITLSAALAALTSDPSFWQGVSDRLVENNATTAFNTSGIVVQAAVQACNANFNYDNVTGSCIAVPMSCGTGTFAAAGTGKCTACTEGRYSAGGVGECSSCALGRYSHRGATSCIECPSSYFQSDDADADADADADHVEQSKKCQQCPWGKYQNKKSQVYCEEVLNNHLLVMTVTKGYEQRQCPRLGVLCENNTKQYAGTHWHSPAISTPNCTVSSRLATSFSSYDDLQCTKMYACVNLGCPDPGASKMQCKPGFRGPLCAVCEEKHYEQLGECVLCEKPRFSAICLFVLGGFVVLVVLRFLNKYRHVIVAMNVMANLKIIVSFITVISTVNTQFGE